LIGHTLSPDRITAAIAYSSDESRRQEVFVHRWLPDSRRILFNKRGPLIPLDRLADSGGAADTQP
jgi:hypothetical protein